MRKALRVPGEMSFVDSRPPSAAVRAFGFGRIEGNSKQIPSEADLNSNLGIVIMSSEADTNDPEMLEQEIKESIGRARDLTNEYRIVQEHESAILENDEQSPK